MTDSDTFVFFIVTLEDKYLYYRIAEKEVSWNLGRHNSESVVINVFFTPKLGVEKVLSSLLTQLTAFFPKLF